MAEDMHKRVLRRPDQALRHLRLALVEALMDAGNDHVQFGQRLIRQVQSAVLQNVHLDPGQCLLPFWKYFSFLCINNK